MTVTMVRETNSEQTAKYTKHDQLFKELIHTFFEEFIEAFFPDVHGHVDFESTAPFPQEVHTDLIDGRTRRLDIVIETKLKNEDVAIIIHVEPQSSPETNFHERMYHYFSLLYNKYRMPIIPIAVFSYDQKNQNRNEETEFSIEFPFFHVLTFNFMKLELVKKSWRDYIKSDNPAAAALMSKMDYTEEERVEVKKEFLLMMARMKLDPARQRLLYGFFETYLKLDEREEEKLMTEIKKMDNADKIMELPISYEERGIEKGKEIGKETGLKEVAVEMLKKGFSVESIAEVTHLEKDEIERLKNE